MMLPTDIALTTDPEFSKYVQIYSKDKDVFFEDFKKAFAKLLELGIARDSEGKVINTDNQKGGYRSAPKKSDSAPTASDQSGEVKTGGCPVMHRAKL